MAVQLLSPDDPQRHSRHFVAEERRTLRETFSRIFRAGKWRPAYERSVVDEPLWRTGAARCRSSTAPPRPEQDGPTAARGNAGIEAIAGCRCLVNDNWVELVTSRWHARENVDNGDIVDNSADAGEAPVILVFGPTPSLRSKTASISSTPPAPFTSCSAATPKTSSSISPFTSQARRKQSDGATRLVRPGCG